MMDERGVKRQAYSKEAPSKSPVVHSSENHEDSKSAKRVSPNNANDDYDVGNPSPKKKSKRSQENRQVRMFVPIMLQPGNPRVDH